MKRERPIATLTHCEHETKPEKLVRDTAIRTKSGAVVKECTRCYTFITPKED